MDIDERKKQKQHPKERKLSWKKERNKWRGINKKREKRRKNIGYQRKKKMVERKNVLKNR